MPRSDLILSLVRASKRGDQGMLRKAVEAMAAEERAKKHNVLADQLLGAVKEINGNGVVDSTPRLNGAMHGPLWHAILPRRRLDSLILPATAFETCNELIEEQQRAELLRSHGLEPRHRLLLSGSPGNGKTVLVEAIAEALMVELIVPRYESLIGSYLGETSTRLGKLFEFVRGRRCVLFLDEFDTLGKERGDARETGEIKRVVSTLLLQIDALPSHVVVAAATNHPETLDRAVWRRFQVRLELPSPTLTQSAAWIDSTFKFHGWSTGVSPKSLATKLAPTSFAELEDFCNDIARRVVLSQGSESIRDIVTNRLAYWTKRLKPTKKR